MKLSHSSARLLTSTTHKGSVLKQNQFNTLKKFAAMFTFLTPMAALSNGFAGAYVGGHLGYVDADDDGRETSSAWSHDISPDGPAFGLLAGYNWVFDNGLVLGVEVDYEERTDTDDDSYQKDAGVTDTDYEVESEIKRAASLRGRLGYLLTPRTLIYTTAGLATARVEREFNDYEDNTSESDGMWQDGWTAGLGLEYVIKDKFSVRAEYRYSDYGENYVDVDMWEEQYNHDLSEDSFRIGLIYRF